jgi:hypothetical protein
LFSESLMDGWRLIKESDVVERVSPRRQPVAVGGFIFSDPRLFSDTDCKNQTSRLLRMIYYEPAGPKNVFQPTLELHTYNPKIDSLHLGPRSTRLDITQATDAMKSEKNWSPFEWHSRTFFVYSIFPDHKIVAPLSEPNCDDGSKETLRSMRFVHSTPFPANFSWAWGHLRGGSPAILVETPDSSGPKYLSFFHSQSRFHHRTVKSYFMGAYLFSSEPPFYITHIMQEPLVPRGDFYNVTELGWAFGNLDFVVFPMGLVLLDNATLALSLGVNDKRCYILEIGLLPLIRSMVRV